MDARLRWIEKTLGTAIPKDAKVEIQPSNQCGQKTIVITSSNKKVEIDQYGVVREYRKITCKQSPLQCQIRAALFGEFETMGKITRGVSPVSVAKVIEDIELENKVFYTAVGL